MKESPYILETERLLFRRFSEKDAPDLFILNADPEVIKYTGDPPFASISECSTFIKNYAEVYDSTGLGRWSVVKKHNLETIGWCGMKRPSNNEVDLGFRFHRKFWNQGFATEASRRCIAYFFENFNDAYIVGRAMNDNHASIRVLEKLGFVFWKDINTEKQPAKCFRLDRP